MTDTPLDAGRMLTVNEACDYIGVKRTKFYALLASGEFAGVVNVNPGAARKRVGEKGPRRSLRVPQSTLDAFNKRNAVTA